MEPESQKKNSFIVTTKPLIHLLQIPDTTPKLLDLSKKRKLVQSHQIELAKSEPGLQVEIPKLLKKGSYTKEDKMRRGLKATKKDLEKFQSIEDIPYRRILFSKIPNHLKPLFEQEEVFKACSTLMGLLEIRDK